MTRSTRVGFGGMDADLRHDAAHRGNESARVLAEVRRYVRPSPLDLSDRQRAFLEATTMADFEALGRAHGMTWTQVRDAHYEVFRRRYGIRL